MKSSEGHVLDPIRDDDVPKIDNAVAVGEDLKFQERWWTFERLVWIFFVLVLIADALGVFGAGWLAHRTVTPVGSGMSLRYDRVLRTGTPSMLAVQFGPDAAADGKVKLLTSESIVKGLGAQRVIPQPVTSEIQAGSVLYTFPATVSPGTVEFELEPDSPGVKHFRVVVPGHPAFDATVVVMP